MLHERGERNSASHGRLVASVVDEVNRSRLGHEVDGGDEDDEERRAKNLDKIEMKRFPDVEDFVGAETENFDKNGGHDWDESEGDNVVDEVLIPEFDVLESDGAGEVRQDWRHFGAFVCRENHRRRKQRRRRIERKKELSLGDLGEEMRWWI